MSIRRILLLFAATLCMGVATHASHISGGEIYYDCIGPNQYRITLVVYRDCAGIGVNNTYDVRLTSPCGNRVLTVSTPGGTEVSQLCDAAQPYSTCNQNPPPNSPVMPGMQQYTYTGIITLPPCNSWRISWEWYYRNQAVANLTDPDDTFIYTEAILNNTAANCNNSPEFTNAAIPYVCQGFPVTYSYGAFDADGDSLAYTFIGARDQNGDPVVYTPGFSGSQPISGITLDPVTGVVQFTLNVQGNWVVVVRVDEYRNGVLIGSVMRDMQFIATPCSNVPPDPTTGLITNPSGTSTQTGTRAIELCENGSFCFNMVISDPNPGDILEATSNITQALPGATFSYTGTNPITCHVCWTATPGTAGFYPFLVSVNDGACPVPALQSYVYRITVMGPPQGNVVVTNETCVGAANGTATVQMTGGVAPYHYLWGNGDTDNSITAGAGSYSVTVTDDKGCVNSALTGNILTTSQPNTANAGADLIGCYGELPVALQGNVTNATGGAWSGGAGTFTGTGLNVTYMPTPAEVTSGGIDLYLTTTGNTNCPSDKDTVHVTLPTNFFPSSISRTNALCNGATNGSATYLPNNSTFTFLWNDPAAQTTNVANNLGAGTYSVHVEDSYGCDTTLNVTITAPAAIAITNMAVTAEQCAGNNDGTITASVTGGTQPYHYTWSNAAGDVPSITVGAGTYSVSVTDARGCTAATASATVNSLGQPNVANAGANLIGCFSALPVQLQGNVTNATGGAWSGGAGTFTGTGLNVTYMPTAAEINSGGIDLYLTTTGNTTCPADKDTVHVTLPTSFFPSSISRTNALCNGATNGSATYLPNNSTFTFLWNDPAAQTTNVANNLGAGTYSVHVEDSYGCDTTLNVTITAPAAIAITNMAVTAEQCAGNNDGTITASVTGGTQPYHYTWSNSAGDVPSITVGAGTYSVSVTDANGCTAATASTTVNSLGQPNVANAGANLIGCFSALPVQLQGNVTNATGGTWSGGSGSFSGTGLNVTYMPTAAEINSGGIDLYLTTTGNTTCPADKDTVHVTLPTSFFPSSISGTNALCNGATDGSATYLPNNPTFTYLWNDPAAQSTHTATGLSAGNYSLHVTDSYGCDTTLSVTIGQPAVILIPTMTVLSEQCAGNVDGSITATVTGGTQPYHYTWSNSAGDVPSIIVGAGTYTVSVTDANGCAAATASASVTALGQPTAANAGADLIGCFNALPVALQGNVTNATGGAWTGGAGSFTGTGLNVTYMPTAAEVTTGGVDLYLTTTGNPTCPTDQDTVHVTLPSSFFHSTLTATPVACSGDTTGAATFLPNNASFTFLWNDADAQTASIATGLSTGSYAVTVTDAFGCDTTATVFVPEPLPLIITGITDTHPTCAGEATGSATVSVTGGTPSYSYGWSENAGGQTTATASNLASGSYTATVVDANGCRTQDNVSILTPAVITLQAQVEDTVCVNAPVQLTAQAQGGNGNFTINWTAIGTGDTLTHYFPTSQIVTVTVSDEKGCTGPTLNFPVTVLDISTATLHTYGDTVLCPGSTATVGAWLTGYPSTSTITWTELSTTGNGPFPMVMTQDRTFTVTAGDACGNSVQSTIVVDVQNPPAVTLPPIIAEGCAPLTAHFPTGLTNQPVTYLWTFGDGTTSNAPAPVHVYEAGIYDVTLTMTTPIGCVGQASNIGQVISHALPVAAFTPDPSHTDMTAPQIHFGDQSTGDVSTWTWTFGDGGSSGSTSPLHTYGAPGIYPVQLTVSDAFGCSSTVLHNVQVDPDYDITVPNVFTPDPNGGGGGTYNPIDLSNDVFYPFIRFAKDFRMRIFNRWGELVFESNDLNQGWDGYYRGQISQQDVYVYQVWVRFVDNSEREKMGDLTLFR